MTFYEDLSKIKFDVKDESLLADHLISEANTKNWLDMSDKVDVSSINTDYVIKSNPMIELSPSLDIASASLRNPTIGIEEKPNIQEALSKIQEELSNLTQVNNELRKERKADQKENAHLREENEQLKAKLKRSRAKTKTVKKTYDSELEEMQEDMNYFQDDMAKMKDIVDFKRYYK